MDLQNSQTRRYLLAGAFALAVVLFGKDFALQLIGLLNAFVPAV